MQATAVAERTIRMIPVSKNIFTKIPINVLRTLNVAAYARVSTKHEEQTSSYEAQVKHYTNHIKSKPEWNFVKVYTDKKTATNTKKREGFNDMIKDALDGKIDLIITKSAQRFARNTVDSLVAIRKLKEKGVEIYFEKENVWTLDAKGELLITIMSSMAQEESRSISENVKWGQEKRRKEGKVYMSYKSFLGYEKGEDGLPKIVEKEAEIVRQIYTLFLEGKTLFTIAKILTGNGGLTKKGKPWSQTTLRSILTNEKYKGDAILQKTYCVDFLTKKMKKNEGELPKFYVENSHPAIVSKEIFDMAQSEMHRRKSVGLRNSSAGIFSAKIICGDCDSFYGSKVWHSNSKYRRRVWQCRNKFKNKAKCKTPHFTEDQLKELFLKAFNQIISDKDTLLSDCEMILAMFTDSKELDKKIAGIEEKYDNISKLIEAHIDENATTKLNQKQYKAKHQAYLEQYEKEKSKLENLQILKVEREAKTHKIKAFIDQIKENGELITEFNEELFFATVEKITVNVDKSAVFTFKNGIEIEI